MFFFNKVKKIDVMITAFRDGFQSVYGARVLTKDFLPAIPAAMEAGLTHFEVGGGARFQAPFFRIDQLINHMDQLAALFNPQLKTDVGQPPLTIHPFSQGKNPGDEGEC